MLCCDPVLQASTYQMAVLLMFNNSDSLTVEQIQEHTQLKTVGAIWIYSFGVGCSKRG